MFNLWTDVAQLCHHMSPYRDDLPDDEPPKWKRGRSDKRDFSRTEEALVAALDKKREQERAGRKRCT